MTNKEELKNRFAKITETKWQRGVVIERMLHNDDLDTVFDFFWNEIEQIRKSDMERVVEVLRKEIDSLYVFGHSQAVGGLYTDEKMRGSNVENASWIKKEDALEVLSIIKQDEN